MCIISVPTIIVSMDSSYDASVFFDVNEEEEKEGVKLLFEITSEDFENLFSDRINTENDSYTYKKYPKPHLNLVSPPPDETIA